MLVSKVELENIKNYEEGSFEFGPGVTAISGPNGAGKTTILEAIAWALFDQLPYKKEDFLRRGAKKGAVRVTFVSALDGREYTVYRDTASGYYIHDPITKIRLVEQKNQVGVWIKQHLGVEASTDLKSLFVSTIGVPQGTFTVDFADQPARRKVGFDKVLRVDEYQRSSDDLRSLVRLVESQEASVREEIARLQGEVAALDGLMAERARQESLVEKLKNELSIAESNREHARKELERLDALERNIARLTAEKTSLAGRIEEMARRLSPMSEEVERSERASEAVAAAEAGFTAYNAANERLAELEVREAERDSIKKQASESERELFKIEAALQGQRDKLKQIEADRVELDRLAPLIEEQESAEAKRSELQTAIGVLSILRKQEEAAAKELKALRAEYADLTKQIDEAEKLKELAARAMLLEEERPLLEEELREMRSAFERLTERKKEARRVRDNIAKLNGEVKTLEKDMQMGLAAEAVAAGLAQLESEDQALMEEIAGLRARIEREKSILAEVQGGLCPLLSERCLNMKEGQGLDQFFKAQMGNEREQLIDSERKRKEIQRKLVEARNALKAASALGNQRVQFARYSQDLEIERSAAARLDNEISSAPVSEESLRKAAARLEKLGQELKLAQAARLKYESLGLIRERQERLRTEGAEKRTAHEELQAQVAAMSSLSGELAEVESRILALDDPRGRSRLLNQRLEKETEVRELLSEMEAQEKDLAFNVRELMTRLEAFSGLDQEVFRQREVRAASEKEHRIYIENKPVASLLASRRADLSALQAELNRASEQAGRIEDELNEASSQYDAQEHIDIKVRLEELFNQVASLASELNGAAIRVNELSDEIDRLLEAQHRLFGLEEKRDRCGQLLTVSEFIRDLLRKAGPFITEAHLQSISIEANHLYREITGNPMVSLRWDMGYEIVLEEEGHERPFASLSGGEQMAAALAVRLALLKELSDMRIAFFDEPTTNMDEERRRNLAQQIGRIKDFDQLFVISHDDAFEGFTDRVVSVRGQADGT